MEGSRISSSRPAATDGEARTSHRSLDRLRREVHRAAEEIERLRTENRALQQRVEALEARPAIGENEAVLTVEDPNALRTQIEGFIDTIDAYLSEYDAPDASTDTSD